MRSQAEWKALRPGASNTEVAEGSRQDGKKPEDASGSQGQRGPALVPHALLLNQGEPCTGEWRHRRHGGGGADEFLGFRREEVTSDLSLNTPCRGLGHTGTENRGSAGGIPERLSQLWDGRAALPLATLRTVLWGRARRAEAVRARRSVSTGEGAGSTGQQPRALV